MVAARNRTQVLPTKTDIERAEKFARIVEIQLRNRNWEAARSILDQAEREYVALPVGERIAPIDLAIVELGLPIRTVNTLDREGIVYVADLLGMTRKQLAVIPGFGSLVIDEIQTALRRIGVRSG